MSTPDLAGSLDLTHQELDTLQWALTAARQYAASGPKTRAFMIPDIDRIARKTDQLWDEATKETDQ